MSWNVGDIWAVEVELPAGSRVEYKYVILEEQDWTQQVNASTEGRVEYNYRIEPDSSPPDVQRITRQMAIVAWQPGPNRLLQVPTEEELTGLRPGLAVERPAAAARATTAAPPGGAIRSYGQQAVGRALGAGPASSDSLGAGNSPRREELTGVWEVLAIDSEGRPFLDRRDVWGRDEPVITQLPPAA
jgi:hypothetical protein